MSQRVTLEHFRLPLALALGLLALLAFALLPRGGSEVAQVTPSPSSGGIVMDEPGGGVISASAAPSLDGTPMPTLTPAATPPASSQPSPNEDFRAQVQVCRSVSNFQCDGEFDNLPRNATTFVALVEFVAARPGDVLVVAVTGPAGTDASEPYTLQGGGEGAYYSTFATSGMPAGSYTVSATHNGAEVATTSFRKADG